MRWCRSPGSMTTREGVARARRASSARSCPWNYPFEVTIHKLGQALATGNTVVLKAAPDTPFNATRIGRLVAERTDIPPGVLNVITASDHLVGEELTAVRQGRPDLVHRIDRGREADHGEGRGDDEAPLPRARRQVRRHHPRRRRPRRRLHARLRGVHARRAGLRHPDADAAAPVPLRRGRRDGEGRSSPPWCPATRRPTTRCAGR